MSRLKWSWLWLAVLPLVAGCGDFWQAPGGSSSTDFSLTNSGNITVSAGATGTSTITVTPSNSFTGSVDLTCAVSSSPSGASSPTTCSLSPSSVSITDTTAQTATLTATTTSATTTGAYQVTVTGVSSSVSESTTVCVEVGTGTCTAAAGNSGVFYVLNAPSSGTPQILGESIVSDALTPVGSAATAPSTPFAMALGFSGSDLYLSTTSGVFVYPVSSGSLGAATQVDSGDLTAEAIGIDGGWLVEAVQGSNEVTFNAVPLNSSTGGNNGIVQAAPFAATNNSPSVQPGKMTISPDGKEIFVALGSGGTVIFPFNPSAAAGTNPFGSTGAVVPVANSGSEALSVAVDPAGQLFYIGETTGGTSGALFAYLYSSIGSASLTSASGSPIASGGLSPNFILPSASGGYVYVANGAGLSSAGNVTSFAVTSSGSTFSIAAGSTVAAGTQPIALAEDSTGSYLLAVSSLGSPYFSSYTFDSTTPGTLDASQVTGNIGTSPIGILAAAQ